MKLKCIAAVTEDWFEEGKYYEGGANRIYDKTDDGWEADYYCSGVWVINAVAVFQEVEE